VACGGPDGHAAVPDPAGGPVAHAGVSVPDPAGGPDVHVEVPDPAGGPDPWPKGPEHLHLWDTWRHRTHPCAVERVRGRWPGEKESDHRDPATQVLGA